MTDQFRLALDREVPDPHRPPRRLVLASAGSGKTHLLTSHMIRLLAMDVPAEEILASTFTRKAAGEISDRLLLRLALGAIDAPGATQLAESLDDGLPEGAGDPTMWATLLVRLCRRLNRLQVQTLDAFFHRVATTFALELGLPLRWRVATEPERERLCAEAVEAAIDRTDSDLVVELVRQLKDGRTDRAVHDVLLRAASALHETFVDLDPAVLDPWGFDGGADLFPPVPAQQLREHIDALADVPLPLTKAGSPHSSWKKARDTALENLRAGDWSAFLAKGFARALLDGTSRFAGRDISPDFRAVVDPLLHDARSVLGRRYQRRVEALGRFLPEFDHHLRRAMHERGLYGFSDLVHAILRAPSPEVAEEVYYRLDARIRHLLLDEFQDTSNVQWAALEPLAAEILSGYEDERAVLVVADPKQSIFGWRGGEPRLLDRIRTRYSLDTETLSGSWRSSSTVLRMVNRVFADVDHLDALEGLEDEVSGWSNAFQPHETNLERPGYAEMEVGPTETEPASRIQPALLRHAATRAIELHREAPGAEIGILTRINASASYLIAFLKELGVEASEEGGVPVTDSAPVLAILALLRTADGATDLASRYLVAKTPLGPEVGLGPEDWQREEVVASVSRTVRKLLLSEGYGRTISAWVRAVSAGLPGRDLRRLQQLTELSFTWDRQATLRPLDFVRFVETSRTEDPSRTAIRVMTIHRSKGLEFDAVFLPDLAAMSFVESFPTGFLSFRSQGAGPVRRVLPRVRSAERALFPELAEAEAQASEIRIRDELSALYVGLTRARHAVHLFVSPEGGGRSRRGPSAERLLCEALAPGRTAEPGTRLYQDGDPAWWSDPDASGALSRRVRTASGEQAETMGPLRLRGPSGRKGLERETPSGLARRSLRPFAMFGTEGTPAARERGLLIHRWLETIEWLEPGRPSEEDLLAAVGDIPTLHTDPADLLEPFRRWIAVPAIAGLLRRDEFPEGAIAEREVPFLIRVDDRMIEGRIDRLVTSGEGDARRVVVVDWKTDSVDPEGGDLDTLVERYRVQLEAYRRAAGVLASVPLERVTACVAFVGIGVVRAWSGGA